MARGSRVKAVTEQTPGQALVAYWREQISKQDKAYTDFRAGGERIIDRYRIEKANAQQASLQDRYNILYSSTETMRPSLYAQTPKCEVKKRHKDRSNPVVSAACAVIESTIGYAIEEVDFDEVLECAIEDYMLPGLGVAWVRYEPVMKDQTDSAGNKIAKEGGEEGEYEQVVDNELLHLDYIAWKDALFGPTTTWKLLPWGAKRVYMDKAAVKARFGQEIAAALDYSDQDAKRNDGARNPVVADKQTAIWEIWDKRKRQVIWISETGYNDVLDQKDDPLRLKGFFPFPKPLRAITNTRTFVPRPFYSQYQSQAEELDNLTQRIRHLTNALSVRGAFDGSVTQLQSLLSPAGGNKMVPIENWHQFLGQSGVNGAIVWVPIEMIVKVLMELYNARDKAKNEIYEITGFSDITRGLSKASETLGAQQIKQDWAGGRLKIMQKEIQRFCRDIVRIMSEIACEHFSDETFALYSGFDLPPQVPGMGHNGGPPLDPMPAAPPQALGAPPAAPPQGGQPPAPPGAPMPPQGAAMGLPMGPPAPPQLTPEQQAVQAFKAALDMIRKERERCANIGIETDSTILPDEENERKDRLEFLGQIGAFLQQAAPTVQQFPQMAGLLGAMMMFSVRSFRAARPIEDEFAKFQTALEKMPPQANTDKDGKAASAQTALQVAQIKTGADAQKHDKELAFKSQQAEQDRALEQQRIQLELRKLDAQARSEAVQLQIKQAELQIKQLEVQIKQQSAQNDVLDRQQDRELAANDQAHQHEMDRTSAAQGQYEFEAGGARQDAQQAENSRQFDASQAAAATNQQESSPGG
jgi:hypothetical protein